MSATGAVVVAAGTRIGDPEGTRTVLAIVALLVVMGLALVMVAFWMRRVTRPDPEVLAPLELMGERAWRNGDPTWQRRRLDEVRPGGAQPLRRSAAPPDIDEAFDAGPESPGFDDLRHERDDGERERSAREPTDDAERDEPGAPSAGDEDEDADPDTDAEVEELPRRSRGDTPIATERPDQFPEHELDPEVLEQAMAELDAELQGDHDDSSTR